MYKISKELKLTVINILANANMSTITFIQLNELLKQLEGLEEIKDELIVKEEK